MDSGLLDLHSLNRVPTLTATRPVTRLPSLRTVFWQQFRLIEYGGMVTSMFVLLLIGLTTSPLVLLGARQNSYVAPHIVAAIGLSFAWPFMVWVGETPDRRRYHWTMPVDPAVHDLMRVAAGAVWLVIAMSVALIIVTLISMMSAHSHFERMIPNGYVLLNYVTAGLITYFMVSPIPLLANRPLKWLLMIGGGLMVLANVAPNSPPGMLIGGLADGAFGLRDALAGAWSAPSYVTWYRGRPLIANSSYELYVISTIIWLPISFLIAFLATRRTPRR